MKDELECPIPVPFRNKDQSVSQSINLSVSLPPLTPSLILHYLSKIQRDGDIVIPSPIRQGGALPPPLAAVNGVGDWVSLLGHAAPSVADVAVSILRRKDPNVLHQLAEDLRHGFSAGGIGCDTCPSSQIEHNREKAIDFCVDVKQHGSDVVSDCMDVKQHR